MKVKPQIITIDIGQKENQTAWVILGELGVRDLDIRVVQNGRPFDISGIHMSLYAKTPKDNTIFNTIDIVDAKRGKGFVTIPEQISTQIGKSKCCITFIKDGKMMLSFDFVIKIQNSIFSDRAIVASNEFSSLVDALSGIADLEGNYVPRLTQLENGKTDKTTTADLSKRVDGAYSQLAEIELEQLNAKNPQIETKKEPVLVFVDDDCRQGTYDYTHRLCKEKNIKISLGCIPEWIEAGQVTIPPYTGRKVVTKEQLKEMYDYGHDLLSHGFTSVDVKSYLNNEAKIKIELEDSKKWLKDNGYIRNKAYENFVYPQGLTGTNEEILKTKELVRRYYKYGITTNSGVLDGIFDSFAINRVFTDGNFNATKPHLDTIITNKGMLIVGLHGYSAEGQNYDTWKTNISQVIDYAQNNGIKILPFSEAMKIKGNVMSIGEYTDRNSIFINNTGSSNFKNVFFEQTYLTGKLMDDTMDKYGEKTETFLAVNGSDDTFLGVGGIMVVVNHAPHMSYAIFYPWSNDSVYRRRWSDISEKWESWVCITGDVPKISTIDQLNKLISEYPMGESIIALQGSHDTFLSKGGTLKTLRNFGTYMSFQLFYPWDGDSVYKRRFIESTNPKSWSTFVKISSI